jgi:hypothetical protein
LCTVFVVKIIVSISFPSISYTLTRLQRTTKKKEKKKTKQQKTHIILIDSKTMINARRHNSQIPLFQPQSNPLVARTPDVKIASAIENIANFLVFVQVFVEEGFYFFFIVR